MKTFKLFRHRGLRVALAAGFLATGSASLVASPASDSFYQLISVLKTRRGKLGAFAALISTVYLYSRFQRLKAENGRLTRNNQRLQDENSHLVENNERLMSSNTYLQDGITLLGDSYQSGVQERILLDAENAELRNSNDSLRTRLGHKAIKYARLLGQFSKRKSTINVLLRAAYANAQTQNAAHSGSLAQSSNEIEEDGFEKVDHNDAFSRFFSKEDEKIVINYVGKENQSYVDHTPFLQAIVQGAYWVQCLHHNQIVEVPKTKRSIVEIVWFLMYEALRKKQGFTEGTFTIHDPSLAIFNFLQQVSGVSTRSSTHFVASQNQGYKVYGVDIVPHTGADGTEDICLPHEHHHVLFGLIDKETMYIKPEEHGLGSTREFVGHGLGFVKSKGRKVFPAVFGADEGESYRKERTPHRIQATFLKLMQDAGRGSADSEGKNPSSQSSLLGIHYMIKEVELVTQGINSGSEGSLYNRCKEFISDLNTQFDHSEMRYGCEVILTEAELNNAAKLLQRTNSTTSVSVTE